MPSLHNPSRAAALALLIVLRPGCSLDNGVGRVPIMGWSSWYGFTDNIDEGMLRGMADAMVSTGLSQVGFNLIAIDDGWAVARDNTTGEIIADPTLFPSGMAALATYVHAKNLTFGIYTCRGPMTCLKRPGSYMHEEVDAQSYAKWGVDFVKSDSCYGERSPDVDYAVMRDALNATGRHMAFAVCNPGFGSGEFGNMWRTAPDLSSQSWDMILNRFQQTATAEQRALVGPGSFPDPDNLEVGYSPRAPPGAGATPLEQRSMFSMWSILPAPLVLSADLRTLDATSKATLTNAGVIAVNQDPLAAPGTPVVGDATTAIAAISRRRIRPRPPTPGCRAGA